jgi:hypothetical protein
VIILFKQSTNLVFSSFVNLPLSESVNTLFIQESDGFDAFDGFETIAYMGEVKALATCGGGLAGSGLAGSGLAGGGDGLADCGPLVDDDCFSCCDLLVCCWYDDFVVSYRGICYLYNKCIKIN